MSTEQNTQHQPHCPLYPGATFNPMLGCRCEQNTQRPTCTGCGKEMIYNVPRMGPAGGYVHADSGKLLCAMEINEQSPPPETGAVDVNRAWAETTERRLNEDLDDRDYFDAGVAWAMKRITQLEQQISELESENQNHAEHRLVYEARIKELEAMVAMQETELKSTYGEQLAGYINEHLSRFVTDVHSAFEVIDKVEAQLESANYMGNLLAIVHGDGGHYRAEHGDKKATDDAIEIVSEMKHRLGRLEHTTYGIPAFPQSITEAAKRHQQQPEQMEG